MAIVERKRAKGSVYWVTFDWHGRFMVGEVVGVLGGGV